MRSTKATIDLDALAWNVGMIRQFARGSALLAMIKANAYGHGLVPIARTLELLKVEMLGLAFVDEAIAMREAGIQAQLLVLRPIDPEDCENIVRYNIGAVVGCLEEAQRISVAAEEKGKTADIHLYVDTGMHRDGVMPDDVLSVLNEIKSLAGLRVTGICTHLATADQAGSPFIREQLDLFDGVVAESTENGHSFRFVHAANTGAIVQGIGPRDANLVRPGLSLYGYAAPEDPEMDLRPVMTVSTTVMASRRIGAGETVSYGRRYATVKETTIVTLPIGYGDGYLRAMSGKGKCIINGKKYPIVGSICMDSCMVDVGDDEVKIGDEVVLLSKQIDAWELAEQASTIPYEITTSISQRVPRHYIGKFASMITEGVSKARV